MNDIIQALTEDNYSRLVNLIKSNQELINVPIQGLGLYPIHIAAQKKDYKLIEYLLKCGANINQLDNLQNSALYYAAKNENRKLAIFLIKKGADIDGVSDTDARLKLRAYNYYQCGKKFNKEYNYIEAARNFSLAEILYPKNGRESFIQDIKYHKRKYAARLNGPIKPVHYDLNLASPIEILLNKTYFDGDEYIENLEDLFNPNGHPTLELILHAAAYEALKNDRFNITFLNNENEDKNPKNSNKEEYGYYNTFNSIIIFCNDESKQSLKGTIYHELVHLVLNKIFNNNSNPYEHDNIRVKNEFNLVIKESLIFIYKSEKPTLTKECIEKLEKLTSWEIGLELNNYIKERNETTLSKVHNEFISIYENYNQEDEHSEFIARAFQVIAENNDIAELELLIEFIHKFLKDKIENFINNSFHKNIQSCLNNFEEELRWSIEQSNKTRVVSILENTKNQHLSDAILNKILIQTAYMKDLELAERIIKSGANPNNQDLLGNTSLMISILNNNFNLANLLLSNQADPNIKNTRGQTPLMLACNLNNINIVKLLLENGALLCLEDDDGKTAKDYAITNVEILELLSESNKTIEVSKINKNFIMDKTTIAYPNSKKRRAEELPSCGKFIKKARLLNWEERIKEEKTNSKMQLDFILNNY